MGKEQKQKAITLISMVITIVILLILAGVAIRTLGGENGLIAKVNQAKKAQIKAEMKEKLTLAITELQTEKVGKATLDDITQNWANNNLTDYAPTITSDASISGKKITMQKSGVTGKYIIDENLNITEIQESSSSIKFSYDIFERVDNKVKILIHVQDKENGLSRIEFPDGDAIIVEANKKEEKGIDYEVEIGVEYKIKIISENGQTQEETILIIDYWYNITKNIEEGIEIDNPAIKAAYNKPYQSTLTTQGNYAITGLTVTMGGQAVITEGNNIVDIATGKIYIEKVTGDIEITVTAKKLEIVTTDPYIGTNTTETDSSKSVSDNTQIIGDTLYINFKATLEGINCTVTLKSDSTKSVPYAVISNGKYTFIVTGTYNGKTITKEIEVVVNKYQDVGGFVQYDAGTWTQEEIDELTADKLYDYNESHSKNSTCKLKDDSGLNFTFGGFQAGDSRNSSVTPESGLGTPKYNGWRILESKEENGKKYITKLVHAGSPENFVRYDIASYDGCRAEYLLSSGEKQERYSTLSDGTTINPRSWDMYKDVNQLNLIEEVHCMNYDEALAITGDASATMGIRNIGAFYWLAYGVGEYLYHVYSNGNMFNLYNYFNGCFGVRPVVSLKTGVYIASGSGTEADPYVLAIETTE